MCDNLKPVQYAYALDMYVSEQFSEENTQLNANEFIKAITREVGIIRNGYVMVETSDVIW